MGLSIWQLLIILAIVALVFGTKRLRNIGGDLGDAIKSFKNAVGGDEDKDEESENQRLGNTDQAAGGHVYDAEVRTEDTKTRDQDKV